jgi:hypothetical protein
MARPYRVVVDILLARMCRKGHARDDAYVRCRADGRLKIECRKCVRDRVLRRRERLGAS